MGDDERKPLIKRPSYWVLSGIGHVIDDVVGVEGKGDVSHQSETAAISLQKSPTRGDLCERRGQELLKYGTIVAVDHLDRRDDIVADEQGESHGGG